MAKNKFKSGDKVRIDCLTEQLRMIQVHDLEPGQEVFILKKDFRDNDKDFYQVSENPNDKYGYIVPENYLQKINN